MRPAGFTRRALLRALTCILLAPMARRAPGDDGGAPEKGQADGAGAGKAGEGGGEADQAKGAGGPAPVEATVLTVVVTGNDQPIPQAEVKLKLSSSAGEDPIGFTDAKGEVVFVSPGKGTAKVRVIVSGWESALREVTLEKGSQRVTVPLTAIPHGG